MESFDITNRKEFMAKLLKSDLFDSFEVREVISHTAFKLVIDGKRNQDYFNDIQRSRTLLHAAAAAYAGEYALVIFRIIYQLVHKSLTETLFLSVTDVAVCHQSEVRVHTGIPAAESLNLVADGIILDIVALTGWADESTGAAA